MFVPRQSDEYGSRQIEAARRVLVDVGQTLAQFQDCLVVVGGWVPDLLLQKTEEPHIGSLDVDLALDAPRLHGGRYADILQALLDTRRYRKGEKDFQLVVNVDLEDGEAPVEVAVEFLAPKEARLKRRRQKLIGGFRVLQADACGVAFRAPQPVSLTGFTVRGARNTVRLNVASIPDFLVMKAHAIGGRDKPKDVYDLCYCLEYSPDGIEELARDWKGRQKHPDVKQAIWILREKFDRVDAFGPQQIVAFHASPDREEREMQARRAYELVQKLLSLLQGA